MQLRGLLGNGVLRKISVLFLVRRFLNAIWLLLLLRITISLLLADVLPEEWTDTDVGTVGIAGSCSYNQTTDVFTVSGGGSEVANTTDSFNYVYQNVTGNTEIYARVNSLQNTSADASPGVMMRDSLAANAVSAYVAVSAGNCMTFTTRGTTGASSTVTSSTTLSAPVWLRLVRNGGQITTSTASFVVGAYYSTNGVNWTLIGTQTLSMAVSGKMGLAA